MAAAARTSTSASPIGRKVPDLTVVHQTGRPDLAEVFVVEMDGKFVELVDGTDGVLPKQDKWVINVSTQFGCPVGCPYCDAGGGFKGNLTSDQILDQVRWVLGRYPERLAADCGKLKVHFSRMGEPALNDALLEALVQLRTEAPWPGVWACLATTAPRNRAGWFEDLRRIKSELFPGRFQLQFSMNSTSEDQRKHLVPIPHWSFQEIAAYGQRFFEPGDRTIVLNFALAQDVEFDPDKLAPIFSPDRFAVKLTPINPTARGRSNGFETLLRSQAESRLDEAVERLERLGYQVVISVGDPGEDEIGSNCGQAVTAMLAQDYPASALS